MLGLVMAGGGYVSSADGRTLSFISYCCSAVAVSKSCGRADLRRIKREALGLVLPCCVCVCVCVCVCEGGEREEGGREERERGREGRREGGGRMNYMYHIVLNVTLSE